MHKVLKNRRGRWDLSSGAKRGVSWARLQAEEFAFPPDKNVGVAGKP